MPGLLMAFPLLLLCLGVVRGHRVQDVTPACPPEAAICEFHLTITQRETMVYYEPLTGNGYPVLKRNMTYFKRIPDECDVLEPIPDKELQTVATADGRYRVAYFINGQLPGPSIVIYEDQQVVVRVKNMLSEAGTSIHWHGLAQQNTPWMDGVSSVTQCPINPEETFTYRFLASPPGTHWYHAHQGTQRSDGLFGALIILERPTNSSDDEGDKSQSKSSSKDDTDADVSKEEEDANQIAEFDQEFILIVQDWFLEEARIISIRDRSKLMDISPGYDNTDQCSHATEQADGGEVGEIAFQSALINGKGHYYPFKSSEALVEVPLEVFRVSAGKRYRFRVINPSLNFGFKISIDDHQLHVIATDGNPLNQVTTDKVDLFPGERFDFYISTNQNPRKYWVTAETLEMYNDKPYELNDTRRQEKPGQVRAILEYVDSVLDQKYPSTNAKSCSPTDRCVEVNCPFKEYPNSLNTVCINLGDLTSPKPYPLPSSGEAEIYEKFLNFHIAEREGGEISTMVNGRRFILPSSPPLIDGDVPFSSPCDEEKCNSGAFCHCTHTVKLELGQIVQIVLLNHVRSTLTGMDAASHPVHIHGHHFHVLKVGYPETDPVTKRYKSINPDLLCPTNRCHNATWANATWVGGHVPGLNDVNPPAKDTLIVPIGGYAVIRFMANNPGWWLMHCHMDLHKAEGMMLLLQEGEEAQMNPPPSGFPRCGTFDWSPEQFNDKLRGPTQPPPPPSPPPQPPETRPPKQPRVLFAESSSGVGSIEGSSVILVLLLLWFCCVGIY